MRAIVMAGGLGTRLRPYTDATPKPLLPLDGTPFLEIILTQLHDAGFDRVTLALHYKAEQIHDFVGDGTKFGLAVDYSVADRLLGTAGPLTLIDPPAEPCLVMNADVLTNVDYADVMAHHLRHDVIATIVLCPLTVHIPFGVVRVAPGRTVHAYEEKPTEEVLVNAGIYVVEPRAWSKVRPDEHVDVPALVERALAAGEPIGTYVHAGDWLDIGTIEQYERGQQIFRHHRSRYLRDAPARELEVAQ